MKLRLMVVVSAERLYCICWPNIQIQLGSHVDKIEERDGVFSIETAQGAMKAKAAVSQ